MNQEKILCAAIWYKGIAPLKNPELVINGAPKNIDSGIVICGHRHSNCLYTAVAMWGEQAKLNYNTTVQGFLTSHNRFVERPEAAKIAWEAKQIDRELDGLMSEDLY